jgi:hypothetical protein
MAERRIVGSHFNKQGKPKRGYLKEEVAKAEPRASGWPTTAATSATASTCPANNHPEPAMRVFRGSAFMSL